MTHISELRPILKDIKDIYQDKDARREFIENMMEDGRKEVDGDIWVMSTEIDEVMQDELSGDEYMLGCFNASFLAGILNLDEESIQILQKNEGYEGLGKAVINGGHLEELQDAYVSADGYGHHFNSYDGEEEEHSINGSNWYRFPRAA